MDRLPLFERLIDTSAAVKAVIAFLAPASVPCWTIAIEKVIIFVLRWRVTMLENKNAACRLVFPQSQYAVEAIPKPVPVQQ